MYGDLSLVYEDSSLIKSFHEMMKYGSLLVY